MGWFDQLNQKEPEDLGSFNYQTEQDQLKRRRALAQQLYQDGTTPLKGQMVPGGPNGFYVGPGKTEQLGQLAKSLLAAYMTYKGDGEQKDLDKKSLDALAYNMDNKPWEKKVASDALKTPLAQEEPPLESNGIQTFPVPPQTPNNAVPLPINPRAERPWVPDIRPAAAQALAGEQPAPEQKPVTERMLGPAPAPLAAPAPAGRPMPDITAQPQPQAQPQGPSPAEQIAYLQRIANSGPAGQLMALQLMAKPQYQHVNVKNEDGSESVLQFDPSGRAQPRVLYTGNGGTGPSPKQLARDEFAGKAYDKLVEAQGQLNDAQQTYGKVQNARELMAKYAPQGGVLSTIRAGIGKMLGEDQSNQLDMSLRELAYADLRNTFGGNPTEGERKALMEVKASVERGTAPSLNALDTLAAGYERRMRLNAQQVDQWRGMYDQYRSQPQQRSNGSMGPAFDQMFPPRR